MNFSTIDVSEVLFHHCQYHRKKVEAFIASTDAQSLSQLEAQVVQQHALDLLKDYLKRVQKATKSSSSEKPTLWSDDMIRQHVNTVDALCRAERELRYAAHAKEIFPLPTIVKGPDARREQQLQTRFAVARLLWLFQKKSEGRSTFPSSGTSPLRYDDAEWILDPDYQRLRLPDTHKFLLALNREVPMSLEWQAVLKLVGRITLAEHGFLDMACRLLVSQGMISKDVNKKVEHFTKSATMEAVLLGNPECTICTLAYSDAPRDDVEPAVKTCCGHYIGRNCLQAWIQSWENGQKEGVPKCPNCRSHLFCQIDMLPERLQPCVREYIAYLRSDPELDQQADSFLLAACEEEVDGCFDPSLGTMLARLYDRSIRIDELIGRLWDLVEIERTLWAI